MQLHELQRLHKNKTAKRIGRGGKRGYQSGRGAKGQLQHGGTPRPEIRDTIKKLPKKRGYKFNSVRTKPMNVSVATLAANFAKGEEVTPKTLLDKGLVRRNRGHLPSVKILANGDIDVALTLKKVELSASAKEKIEKAGGSIV